MSSLPQNAALLLKFKEHLDAGKFTFKDDPSGKLFINIEMDEKELNAFLKLYDPTVKRISKKKQQQLLDESLNSLMDYIVQNAIKDVENV